MRRGAPDGFTRAKSNCGFLLSTNPPVYKPLTSLIWVKLHNSHHE